MKFVSFTSFHPNNSTNNKTLSSWSIISCFIHLYFNIIPCEGRLTLWEEFANLLKLPSDKNQESSPNTTTNISEHSFVRKNDKNRSSNSNPVEKNESSSTSTTPFVCPEYDPTLFYQQNLDPYLCFQKKCWYMNGGYAGGTSIDVEKHCILKCPHIIGNLHDPTMITVNGQTYYIDNTTMNIIFETFLCADDCYYSNSYEVELAGYNITKDCVRGGW
jgi:hypothetical protein